MCKKSNNTNFPSFPSIFVLSIAALPNRRIAELSNWCNMTSFEIKFAHWRKDWSYVQQEAGTLSETMTVKSSIVELKGNCA